MEQQTHYFFAAKLPDEVKARFQKDCDSIKKAFSFRRWVYHEDFHITLAFLGFAPDDQLEKAVEYVSTSICGSKSLTLKMKNLGIFGNEQSPRIFFADIEESNELQLIRQRVVAACNDAGFIIEKRPFHPHITLARKWIGDVPFQKEWLHSVRELQPEPLSFEVNEVVLYQTHLQKTPKYEAIRIFSLD